MARIRTIKPDFWTDEKVVELSMEARLFFIGSWNFSDDNGNLQRSARKLKMQIFPADAIDCEPLIQSLIAHGMLIEYSVNGETFLHIKGFKAHQVINRPSKTGLPEPDSVSLQLPLTESSLTEGKGKERKGKEEKKEREKTTPDRKVEINTWLATLDGEDAIPADDPIFEYAEKSEIPVEFLALSWARFRDDMRDRKIRKINWRAHYRNAVKGNWYKLWWFNQDGICQLTTTGEQARRTAA